MHKVRRGHIGFAVLILSVMVLTMCAIALLQVYAGPAKTDANVILSPWNFTQAPPQSISSGCVRVIEAKKSISPGSPKPTAKAMVSRSVRTASAVVVLR